MPGSVTGAAKMRWNLPCRSAFVARAGPGVGYGRRAVVAWPSEESTCRSSRNASPTDQAWKGHPRGVCGASASAISEMCPIPASVRWANSGARNRRRASPMASGVPPRTRTQASTNGPSSQGQTVPW